MKAQSIDSKIVSNVLFAMVTALATDSKTTKLNALDKLLNVHDSLLSKLSIRKETMYNMYSCIHYCCFLNMLQWTW